MLPVLCEKRADRLNLRGNDTEQSHLLSPLLVIDAFCLFINFERWKVMSALTAFQHFTVHWFKWYHYFRAGNQQSVMSVFFALSLRRWNESCVGSSVWPGTASLSGCAWSSASDSAGVQVVELGRRAWGEDQRLQLGRFYSSDDGCFRSLHIWHLHTLDPKHVTFSCSSIITRGACWHQGLSVCGHFFVNTIIRTNAI